MSRGQRQRLKRRETGDQPVETKSDSKPKTKEPASVDAKTRVADILRKREKKLEAKQSQHENRGLNPEEKAIKAQVKKGRKEQRKRNRQEDDKFDEMLDNYKSKLLNQLKEAKEE